MQTHWLGVVGLACLGAVSCAAPCVDDGIDQEQCPQNDTQTESASGDSGTSAATATDSATTMTATDSASATAASMSASASGADSTTEGAGTTTVGQECPVLEDSWRAEPPTFLLLIDQSGSMTMPFDTSTRWEVLGDTLFDPDVGAVAAFQDQIRFGLALYTNTDPNPDCPELTETAPMLGAFDEIAMAYEDADPQDNTPTGDSITAVTAELVADPAPGERVIVLVTDGEPDTCEVPNPQMGQDEAVQAATAAFDQGVRTVVVSVADEVSADHLQDMANAGAGVGPGDPDAPFYVALDQDDLATAFAEIISTTRPCAFTLQQPLMAGQAQQCTVTVNGDAVPLDDPDGWQTDGDMGIALVGGACDAIQTGAGMVEMVCSCDAVEGG